MAQVAPVSGPIERAYTRHPRSPDIFSGRAHAIGRWAVPFALALVYGYWVAAFARDGGPITTGNLVLGFVSTIVFTVVMATLLYVAPRLSRELHAFVWFLFTGAASGFLIAQAGLTDTRGLVATSVGLGAIVGLIVFYWAYTHEDARGHRIG
ncbi:hypothetical protein ACF061_10195 [Streptomyces sp. NPDC015220]|uniref:hypothetical protein n=1 Tax=Streptomyces sp. NPDC015220 TaxID=3364947 RepID=UPI0036FF7711